MRTLSITIALLCGLLACGAVALAQENMDVQPGQVPSFCGIAVGEQEQEYDAGSAFPWTLKLIFADKETRNYLSDVEVTVVDEKGTEWLQTLCEGAWMVMALPPGVYKVTSNYNEQPQERTIKVPGGKLLTEYYFW